MVYGIWYMVYGIWYIVYGIWLYIFIFLSKKKLKLIFFILLINNYYLIFNFQFQLQFLFACLLYDSNHEIRQRFRKGIFPCLS